MWKWALFIGGLFWAILGTSVNMEGIEGEVAKITQSGVFIAGVYQTSVFQTYSYFNEK